MSHTKKLTLFVTNVKKNENQVRKNEISRRRKRVLQILIIYILKVLDKSYLYRVLLRGYIRKSKYYKFNIVLLTLVTKEVLLLTLVTFGSR